ncbi:hypothetical protein SLA2020_083140 [Shorea laevis]
MGSRLWRRMVNFANLPIKLLMPSTFTNIREIALKTIPSASKTEIKRVLESLYSFNVKNVRTLNMQGKKKKAGGMLFARPDYKKVYVPLRTPLSISKNLFPIKVIQEERQSETKNKNVVDEEERKRHWFDERKGSGNKDRVKRMRAGPGCGGGEVKFPWSSMKKAN